MQNCIEWVSAAREVKKNHTRVASRGKLKETFIGKRAFNVEKIGERRETYRK